MRAQTPPARRSQKPKPRTSNQTPRKPVVSKNKQASIRRARRIQSANPDAKVRKSGNVFFLYHKKRKRISWRLVVTIILVFFVGVGTAVSFATISNMERQIAASQARLTWQQTHNLHLESNTVARYSHEEIAHRARILGFNEPDPSQIIYFYTPVSNSVHFRYNPVSEPENHFWQGVTTFIRDTITRIIN